MKLVDETRQMGTEGLYHAGLKDWRDGGKPLCGVGPMGWCFLSPSIEAFLTKPERKRCPACERSPLVSKQINRLL